MSPSVATAAYLCVIAWFFWRDIRAERHVTRALWIPVIWLTICSTRYVSQWLDIFGINLGGVNVEEGSPLDALVFMVLIVAGLRILNKRRVHLAEVLRHNRYFTFFFAYCALSILWSDFPFVAFKRLFKDMGHPIMVLILLTEPDPEEAVIRLVKRSAFVFVPISILFIKYFPALGRGYSEWTGEAWYTGVTMGKNALGLVCFVLGMFFFWYLLKTWRMERGKERRNELILIFAFLAMIGWLFHMAQSSTSLVSCIVAIATIVFLNFRWVNPRYIGFYLLLAVLIGVVAEGVFGVYTGILHILGKNATLTDRTYVWHDLLEMNTNPLIGVGFESFWLGDRLIPLWAKWNWHPNEAHNGYLEIYLTLGLIGLALFIGLFVSCYQRARQDMIHNIDWGRFRFAFLMAVIFYNWTEVPFRATNPLWFYFFLVSMDYPVHEPVSLEKPADADDLLTDSDEEEDNQLEMAAPVDHRIT